MKEGRKEGVKEGRNQEKNSSSREVIMTEGNGR